MAAHSSILAWRIPMDRGAWWATVHNVAKNWTRLKRIITERFRISFRKFLEGLYLFQHILGEIWPNLYTNNKFK